MITNKVFCRFLENEHILPVGICGNCRLVESLNTSQPRPFKRLNYEQIEADLKNPPLLTKQNPLCSCIIRQAGRQKYFQYFQCTELKNPIVRP